MPKASGLPEPPAEAAGPARPEPAVAPKGAPGRRTGPATGRVSTGGSPDRRPKRPRAGGVRRSVPAVLQGTTFGVPASKRALAGSVKVFVEPPGSTQGQVFAPKKAGFAER